MKDFITCSCFVGGKDAFVLCRIFQKSGLGPPNGDRYAPFIEEEWDNDASLVVPGEEAGDEMVNGDDAQQIEGNELEQVCAHLTPCCGSKIILGAVTRDLYIFPSRFTCKLN